MPGRRLVLFGAGMTGRGQVAQLAFEDGWDLTLVDRDASLIRLLREAGRYTVRLLSERPREVVVTGYRAWHVSESAAITQAVCEADLVVTSVLEPNLPQVAATLAPALTTRLRIRPQRPLNVVAAENMVGSSTALHGYLRRHMAGDVFGLLAGSVAFPDSMIARVVPVAADPLLILAEEYSEWTADRRAVVGAPPELRGLEWVDNQPARLQRKLFIHNTGHAICGYLGWLAGYHYVHQAAGDPQIMARLSAAIAEAGEAVSREHGFAREEVRGYEDNLKKRLVIATLPDDLRRVIRQPIRKLGREERLVGPLLLCHKHGVPGEALCYGVAAALRARVPGDEEFERLAAAIQKHGPLGALRELVGYEPPAAFATAIREAYEELGR